MKPRELSPQEQKIRDDLRLLNKIPSMDTATCVPGQRLVERPESQAHLILKEVFGVDVRPKPSNERVVFTQQEYDQLCEHRQRRVKRLHLNGLSTVVDDSHHLKPQRPSPDRDYHGG